MTLKTALLFAFLFVALFPVAGWASDNPDKDLIALSCIKILPAEDEEEIWFKSHAIFDVDDDGYIYTFDPNHHHYVLKMDPQGRFVKKIGQLGQGPGDIYEPKEVRVSNGKIFVRDSIGVSVFTTGGVFLSKFKIFNPVHAFNVDNEQVYTVEQGTKKLVMVYDAAGKKLSEFGEKYDVDYSLFKNREGPGVADKLINSGYIRFDEGKFLFLPFLFGEIHFYASDHTARQINKIPGLDEELAREHYQHFVADKSKRFYKNSVTSLFRDVDVCAGRFYIMDLGRDNYDRIFEYDCQTVRLIKGYKYFLEEAPKDVDFVGWQLRVKKRGKDTLFYVSIIQLGDRELSIRIYKEK